MKTGDDITENVIYGDVLAIINFSMDFAALFITAKLLHIKIKNTGIFLASISGAVYSVAYLAIMPGNIIGGVISIAFSLLMTLISYGKMKKVQFFRTSLVFYAVSFGIGGGITAICNLFNIWRNSRNVTLNGKPGIIYGDVPPLLLIALGLFCALFSLISGKIAKNKAKTKTFDVEAAFNGTTTTFTGLKDTGNLLREPFGNRPVIITGLSIIRPIIPPDIIGAIRSKDITKVSDQNKNKLRLIPVSSLGGKGLLFAFLPDSVLLDGKNVDVCIAVDEKIKDFGGCDALLPACITE